MPPVIVPIVHANVLGAVALSGMFVAVLLQIAAVDGTPVTCGVGFTVTVIVYGAAAGQLPPVDVGVTRYCTVPAVALLGLDRKSTRLNSSHSQISYAVFCLKKKKK